ncbi:MAG TPA: EamA family transporter [Candidatus Angelobacter sp.]|jgi:drug/metabolite transporter (DMT)-like permease|nr:EamA family transporter [Candidatus Angelobacter sp.]
MSSAERQHRFRVITAFTLLSTLWGGTYLAMRVAVEHMAPYTLASVRYMISGPIMLAACALAGQKIRLNRQDALRLLAIGALLLSVGNIGVIWAEEYLPSGLTALLVAVLPIWMAIIEAWIFKGRRIPPLGMAGLALGIAGIFVLLWPKLSSGTRFGHAELIGVVILLTGSFGWAYGSVLSSRWTLSIGVFAAIAWQMTLGGLVDTVVALGTGGFHHVEWTFKVVLAIAYLVICGSWIGFTCYIWLLEHVAAPKVGTYAYVNPVVAVVLGWLFLDEKVDGYMFAGTAIILAAVAMVNLSKLRMMKTPVSEPAIQEHEVPVVEAGAD